MATRWLPDEVVIEILSWLPAKDLLRSRCVCKAWLRLLTIDLHFHKLHLHRIINHHPKHNPYILIERPGEYNSFYLAATDSTVSDSAAREIHCPFNQIRHSIFGICNGLVCLGNRSRPLSPLVYVWNPLTNDHVTITCPPIPSHFPRRTSRTSITYGFGFCHATMEFKVIRILSSIFSEFKSDVSVFTLGTNLWRTLGSIPYHITISKHHTAFVNGALHWFAERPGLRNQNIIVSFNMKQEIFQQVPHPNVIKYRYRTFVTIGELVGLLSIFCAHSQQSIHIWVMKEYGNVDSWTKLFTIGYPEVSWEFYCLQPLGLADSGEIIIWKNCEEVILYNPLNNSIRTLKKSGWFYEEHFTFYEAYPGFYGPHPCLGSIVSPTLVNGVNASPI